MKQILLFLSISFHLSGFSQVLKTPLQNKEYKEVTSYDELSNFIYELDQNSDLLTAEPIGKSVQGRNLYAMKFSSSEFGKDDSKVKVLFIAQQHGNEQSGKEGALLLALEILKPENQYLFDKIDIAIIPQMNPDGSELNQRRNGNDTDLNRNHLILTEPEVIAVHKLFNKYKFHVTLDVHEYFPFGDTWKEFGYRDNSSILVGINTNPDIAREIRDLQKNEYQKFINEYLNERNISNFIYTPGGPPEIKYIRQSTFDINDGRQSFGIQNTFSFIHEGMNGTDGFIENIKYRTESQMEAMMGLLKFTYLNHEIIKETVIKSRENLINNTVGNNIGIQFEHVNDGSTLPLPLYSYATGNDTVINVMDYRGKVEPVFEVKKPIAYLIPRNLPDIMDWLKRHNIYFEDYKSYPGYLIKQYSIIAMDSLNFEGDMVVNPKTKVKIHSSKMNESEYIIVPTSQLKGNMLVIALEPKSELGLVTYPGFSNILKLGETYPIYRVELK